ncbi:MAG: fibronectin type III domain-containing protein [Candidatus Zixiibacteriota bacterium]
MICKYTCVSLFAVLLALLLLDTGCGPKPKTVLTPLNMEPSPLPRMLPYDLHVDVAYGKMTVAWRTHGLGMISGYNVYISPFSLEGAPLDSIRPFNVTPYPGDTNPDDSMVTFEAEPLDNGVKYYVSVRVLYPDGRMSAPSNEVTAVCGFRGEIEMPVRFSGDNDGFSLSQGKAVRADSPDNDLYFFTNDRKDYLASPVRLGGFLRETKFAVLSVMGTWQQLRESVVALNATPTNDKAAIRPGHWLLLKTADETHALVQVLRVSGKDKDRKLLLFVAHCPLKGELIF